jgi:hypothetical protein
MEEGGEIGDGNEGKNGAYGGSGNSSLPGLERKAGGPV